MTTTRSNEEQTLLALADASLRLAKSSACKDELELINNHALELLGNMDPAAIWRFIQGTRSYQWQRSLGADVVAAPTQ